MRNTGAAHGPVGDTCAVMAPPRASARLSLAAIRNAGALESAFFVQLRFSKLRAGRCGAGRAAQGITVSPGLG
jgi:hypothetical protein